jgi:hypothetical protein
MQAWHTLDVDKKHGGAEAGEAPIIRQPSPLRQAWPYLNDPEDV